MVPPVFAAASDSLQARNTSKIFGSSADDPLESASGLASDAELIDEDLLDLIVGR
jgi:hypothetical protein